MAPSAVETAPAPEVSSAKLNNIIKGVYRDLASKAINRDAELKGGEGFEAAKVRRDPFQPGLREDDDDDNDWD